MFNSNIKGRSRPRQFALVILICLLIAGMIAFLTDTISFNNTFSINDRNVDITGAEYNTAEEAADAATEEGELTGTFTQDQRIAAGDTLSKVVIVKKTHAADVDCYVRAKLTFTDASGATDAGKIKTSWLDIDGNTWTFANDGYYYLNTALTDTTAKTLFTKVTVPAELKSSDTGDGNYGISIDFEAIQTAHVTQDLTADSPWGTGVPDGFTTVDVGKAVIHTPIITSQPASQSVNAGENAVFKVAATRGTLAYQWYKGDTAINGATSSTYSIVAAAADAGTYSCKVTNANGTTSSDNAALTVDSSKTLVARYNIGSLSQSDPEKYNADTATSTVMASLYSDGEFTVTGSGNTQVMGYTPTPWYTDRASIKKATIASTVGTTDMSNWFYDCSNLTQAPVIPSSVTSILQTFAECTSLTQAPAIPSSVTNMYWTFYKCTSLTQAPTIPDSVTNMSWTFDSCTNLTQAPDIPSNVTNMESTFYGCTALTGSMTINVDPSVTYTMCFYGASTNDGTALVVNYGGSCTQATAQSIVDTANSGTEHITLGTQQ